METTQALPHACIPEVVGPGGQLEVDGGGGVTQGGRLVTPPDPAHLPIRRTEEGGGGEEDSAPLLEKFCIQPLWFGGIDNVSSGLDMLHQCPTVIGAQPLTEDGLYWGGDPTQAQEAMDDPSLDRVMTGFDFKFFVQSTIWSRQTLEKEIEDGVWFTAEVSKDVLFKSRDRMGTRRAKPLWTEIMELLGGRYKEIRDEFYKDE